MQSRSPRGLPGGCGCRLGCIRRFQPVWQRGSRPDLQRRAAAAHEPVDLARSGPGSKITNGRIESSTLQPQRRVHGRADLERVHGYLTIFDLKTGKIVQEEGVYPNTLDPAAGEPGEEVAADGPFYSPDGKTLWVPQTGDIAKFTVDPETGMVSEKVIITDAEGRQRSRSRIQHPKRPTPAKPCPRAWRSRPMAASSTSP